MSKEAMCNPKPTPPPPSYLKNPTKIAMDFDDQELHRWPTANEAIEEMKAIAKISGPTTMTGLILYTRAMISMLFLGNLGDLELAGGSLGIGIANITGYAVISGLAMGMEPICSQAYGAKQMKLMGLTLHRTVLLLLSASLPISFLLESITWKTKSRKMKSQDQESRIDRSHQV